MMSITQLKLYRAILVRKLGKDGLHDGPQPMLTRTEQLSTGNSLVWKVTFDQATSLWVLSFQLDNGEEWDGYRSKVLADIAGEIGYEIHAIQGRLEFEADQEAERLADLEREDQHVQELAKIGGLDDEQLLAGYEAALVEDLRTTDCVQEWGWHPAYTGPDDPGLGYYEEQSRMAGEIRDAYVSEMKRRGLYDGHNERIHDQAFALRGYDDDVDRRFWPPAKSA